MTIGVRTATGIDGERLRLQSAGPVLAAGQGRSPPPSPAISRQWRSRRRQCRLDGPSRRGALSSDVARGREVCPLTCGSTVGDERLDPPTSAV